MKMPQTPLDFARRAMRLYPEREAVVDGELRLTYRQFFERCDRWSSALQALGVRRGDRVAYIAPNTHEHLESFYAVPQVGAVLVPVNFRLSPEDFAYIIDHSGARVVCVHIDYLDAVERVRSRLTQVEHFVVLGGAREGWRTYGDLLMNASVHFAPADMDEDDLISINYTSGTTSRPKGVMITHRNAWTNVVGTLLHEPLSVGERYLWTLPMFHANGWTFVWSVTARGATHVCLPKPEPHSTLHLLDRERIDMFCAAPTVLINLLRAIEDAGTPVRPGVRVWTAGAPPAAATIERLEEQLGWSLTQVYGLTETSPFISVCEERPEHGGLSRADRSVIKARQGVELLVSGELRVVDEAGEEVAHDGRTAGEITVRGNAVMHGYYRDPEATVQAIRGGWFHTGDAAVVHPCGYVEIRDRIKDVIISGGENISSVEIEGVLLRHPAILEAAVVGMPHEEWGESPHAFVTVRNGIEIQEQEIKDFVRSHLAHFKAPKWVTVMAQLPKTATGKVQKYILRGGRSAIVRQ